MTWLLRQFIHAYRRFVSPLFPACCRFQPSCSAYWLEALAKHGLWAGTWLGVRRVLRCQPFHPGGPDPVPESLRQDGDRQRTGT